VTVKERISRRRSEGSLQKERKFDVAVNRQEEKMPRMIQRMQTNIQESIQS
jgi:hypothetical protein